MNWRSLLGLSVASKAADTFVDRDEFANGGTALPRSLYDYGQDVQQGFDSNVIMSPVMWIMRTFTEAQAIVESKTHKIWQPVEDHDAEVLIDQPNDDYDGDALWKATAISYVLNGNGYWQKLRNSFGDVVQLWYRPHWVMSPKYPDDGSVFISHYELRLNGRVKRVEKRDVIHFRFGLDPRNTRLGLSPLHALLREVYTDDEAANFSAQILENMGVPGLVLSPKTDAFKPAGADLDKLKEYIRTAFTRDNRGAAMVMGTPTDVHQYGFDPQKLTLANLRDIAEERVCAAIGIPAAVVGFGAGLQSTQVGATMRELRRLAWVQCLTPMQKSLARQLTSQLLPDFVSQTRRFRVRFDLSDVSAFQEEDDLKAKRIIGLVQGGLLRVDRGQDAMGLEVDETQKVYLRPSNSVPIDEHGHAIEQATPNGAANGASSDAGRTEDSAAPVNRIRRNGATAPTNPE